MLDLLVEVAVQTLTAALVTLLTALAQRTFSNNSAPAARA